MKRRRLKIGNVEGCSKQERYLYALAAFCLSTAFQKFSAASGDPIAVILILPPAILLNSTSEELAGNMFKAVIQGKKNPPETGSEGGILFFIC